MRSAGTARMNDLEALANIRHGLVPILGYVSTRRHVTFALWTRRRCRPSGKKVLYTPHPGLRARVRRARRVGPYVSAIGPGAVPAHPSPGVVDPQTMHT